MTTTITITITTTIILYYTILISLGVFEQILTPDIIIDQTLSPFFVMKNKNLQNNNFPRMQTELPPAKTKQQPTPPITKKNKTHHLFKKFTISLEVNHHPEHGGSCWIMINQGSLYYQMKQRCLSFSGNFSSTFPYLDLPKLCVKFVLFFHPKTLPILGRIFTYLDPKIQGKWLHCLIPRNSWVAWKMIPVNPYLPPSYKEMLARDFRRRSWLVNLPPLKKKTSEIRVI